MDNMLNDIIDNSVPHALEIKSIEQMGSDVHYHDQLISVDESKAIIKDKYNYDISNNEMKTFIAYHDLILKIHCKS